MGHTVDVRFDEQLGRVLVFAGGSFVCEALNDQAMRMGAMREDLAALHRRKTLAKQRVTAYNDDRGVLRNPDKHLAEIAAQARATTLVSLPPPPTPAGVRAIPKMLPALDQAATQLAQRQSAAEAQAPAHPQMPEPARRGLRSDAPPSRLTSGRTARPAGAGPGETGDEREARDVPKSRYELLEEING
jgi:hypothetical protein